jgi:hypothetical protein
MRMSGKGRRLSFPDHWGKIHPDFAGVPIRLPVRDEKSIGYRDAAL